MIQVKVGTTTPIDITRFVVDLDDIPVITRNRDYSAIGENVKLSLHDDIRNEDVATSSLVYVEDATYQIYRNGSFVFTGKVSSVEYKYGKNRTEIELEHPITSMKKIEFTTYEMASYLSPHTQSYTIYNYPLATPVHTVHMMKIPEFIEGCFNRIGFNVDTGSYDTMQRYRRIYSGPSLVVSGGFDMISYDMVWGLNQTVMSSSAWYNSNIDAINNRIYLFDVVDKISNIFRFGYRFTGHNTVKLLVNSDETSTYNYYYDINTDIGYSNILNYVKKDIPKYKFEPTGAKYDYYLPPINSTPTQTDLIFYFIDNGNGVGMQHISNDILLVNSSRYRTIDWYNNLLFYWFGTIGPSNYVSSSLSTSWMGTDNRYSGGESTLLDNNINQYEEITVKDFDLSADLKPVVGITIQPTEVPNGERIKITQYRIDI